MDTNRFQALRELTREDRKAIYEYAMKRSDEILRGIDEPPKSEGKKEDSALALADER